MKIDALKPHDKNPRKISKAAMAKLCESIERDPEFMRLRPIVVDEDGMILGGNQRWRACKKLGMKTLPDDWVVQASDLSDEQRRRFVLVDNAPEGMAGGWDMDILTAEYGDLVVDLGLIEAPPRSSPPKSTWLKTTRSCRRLSTRGRRAGTGERTRAR